MTAGNRRLFWWTARRDGFARTSHRTAAPAPNQSQFLARTPCGPPARRDLPPHDVRRGPGCHDDRHRNRDPGFYLPMVKRHWSATPSLAAAQTPAPSLATLGNAHLTRLSQARPRGHRLDGAARLVDVAEAAPCPHNSMGWISSASGCAATPAAAGVAISTSQIRQRRTVRAQLSRAYLIVSHRPSFRGGRGYRRHQDHPPDHASRQSGSGT